MSAVRRTVLVTGAFGNVGRYAVRELLARGHQVVATDVKTAGSLEAAAELESPGLTVHWADLRDGDAVAALVRLAVPTAVIHLAAVIPPLAYANPALAHAVNVDGTRHVVAAVAGLDGPCRIVFASSIAVYGSRNPHRGEQLTAATPTRPRDVYGAHKVAAEALVTASSDFVILRLGAVMFPEASLSADDDAVFLEGLLPHDGRIETVDVRDAATALAAATTAPCAGKVLLIGGGPGNQLTLDQVGHGITSAMGLRNVLVQGRPGDPTDDDAWFVTDWMDTAEAQALLKFQAHTFADTMRDVRAAAGLLRLVLGGLSPLVRIGLWWRSPMRGSSATHAPLWQSIEQRWGPDALAPDPLSTES